MVETGGPAFPCMPPQDTGAGSAVGYPHPEAGMTLRQYAAIKLQVPNSGDEWLDDMIQESRRMDFAAKAMGGWFANKQDRILKPGETLEAVRAQLCRNFYAWADAMMAARNLNKEVGDEQG